MERDAHGRRSAIRKPVLNLRASRRGVDVDGCGNLGERLVPHRPMVDPWLIGVALAGLRANIGHITHPCRVARWNAARHFFVRHTRFGLARKQYGTAVGSRRARYFGWTTSEFAFAIQTPPLRRLDKLSHAAVPKSHNCRGRHLALATRKALRRRASDDAP